MNPPHTMNILIKTLMEKKKKSYMTITQWETDKILSNLYAFYVYIFAWI
jgi:hypothetical protein